MNCTKPLPLQTGLVPRGVWGLGVLSRRLFVVLVDLSLKRGVVNESIWAVEVKYTGGIPMNDMVVVVVVDDVLKKNASVKLACRYNHSGKGIV